MKSGVVSHRSIPEGGLLSEEDVEWRGANLSYSVQLSNPKLMHRLSIDHAQCRFCTRICLPRVELGVSSIEVVF